MSELKRHDLPPAVERAQADWSLCVTGAVSSEYTLSHEGLVALPTVRFDEDFVCEADWFAEGVSWRGVDAGVLLDRAEPTPEASFGLVHALDSSYACGLPLDRLRRSVLALELDGKPLSPVHGGPARLVPTDSRRDCWESVKWVREIELLADRPDSRATAKELALSRLSND